MARQMCDEEMVRTYFNQFDEDGDGVIAGAELYDLLYALGNMHVKDDDIKRYLRDYDFDGSGTIEFSEFYAMYQKIPLETKREGQNLLQLFNIIDKDSSKSISKDEVKEFLQSLGCDVSDAKVEQIMNDSDRNHDGKVNFKEFCIMCRKHMK